MEQMNFHKQKLYSLIAAGIALIALFLPWISVNFLGYSSSLNGMRSWGLLSLIGVGAIAALSFMGNKADDYTAEYKKYVMAAFGAIALGAILFLIRKSSYAGSDFVKTGLGLYICLIAGLGGLALAYGLIKLDTPKGTPKTGGM